MSATHGKAAKAPPSELPILPRGRMIGRPPAAASGAQGPIPSLAGGFHPGGGVYTQLWRSGSFDFSDRRFVFDQAALEERLKRQEARERREPRQETEPAPPTNPPASPPSENHEPPENGDDPDHDSR